MGKATADDRAEIFAQRAQDTFAQSKTNYQAKPEDPAIAWQFARACYDWADWATNKTERAGVAREGIAACQQSLVFTNSAPAHYYMAMDMGQLARVETFHGLKLVHEMEREFQAAADLDKGFDFAGPERSLGLLYRDAPGWPISIGNCAKASQYLEAAATLSPDYPENLLNLAESSMKWDDPKAARKELNYLDALWPQAQRNLNGPAWESSWDDWSKRRDDLREKLKQR